MLSYEEFKKKLTGQVRDMLPEKYRDVEIKEIIVTKNNDRQMEGLSVKAAGNSLGPVFYYSDMYADYIRNGSYENTAVLYMNEVRRMLDVVPEIDVRHYCDWQCVKDRIVPELVSMRMNEKLLEELVHQPVAGTDLAITLRIRFEVGKEHCSVKVTNRLMDSWGVDKNYIYERAFSNMKTCLTLQIQEITSETLDGIQPKTYTEIPDVLSAENAYILGNREQICGAAEVLRADLLQEMSQKFGCSFYLVPMNLNEVTVIPQTGDADIRGIQLCLLDYILSEGNKEMMLSDQVYFYDREKSVLSMATDPEQTKELWEIAVAQYVGKEEQEEESLEQ